MTAIDRFTPIPVNDMKMLPASLAEARPTAHKGDWGQTEISNDSSCPDASEICPWLQVDD